MNVRLIALFSFVLALAGFAQAAPADARGRDGGETKIFADVYVPPGETIDGDVNVVFGDATIAGVVTGDCNAVFGQCTLRDGGVVRGQINGVTNDGVRAFVPWAVHRDRGFGAFAEQDHRLFVKLLASAIVVLIFLLFPLRMRVALDRVEKHPALSAATGAVAAVAIVPIALLLLVSIIGIPLIPLEIAAVIAGVWIGTGAIALVVGPPAVRARHAGVDALAAGRADRRAGGRLRRRDRPVRRLGRHGAGLAGRPRRRDPLLHPLDPARRHDPPHAGRRLERLALSTPAAAAAVRDDGGVCGPPSEGTSAATWIP